MHLRRRTSTTPSRCPRCGGRLRRIATVEDPARGGHDPRAPGPAPPDGRSGAGPAVGRPPRCRPLPAVIRPSLGVGRCPCRTRLDCPAVADARSPLMTGPAGGSSLRSARCSRRQPPRRRCPPAPARSANGLYVAYAPSPAPTTAALAGQHTDELLSEILGLSKDDVAALRGRRIVGG